MNAIEVKNISKSFRLYHDKSLTLKERLLFFNRAKYEEVQVLSDVSFDVKKGTTVGLIGRNGSGKSTLLKLLSGIIYPDSGEIKLNGRVSSLLELGAGFHPDFTGRENIYNNASIFGLSRKEIDKRYNQIVEFSELDGYIDNPVRTYSSGMYMRLAFSVAINVDADILLIDEILAVGDANFQKKCMDKINELKNKGITIVLVSHDMGSVERICDKAIWLDDGKIKYQGDAYDTVYTYLEHMGEIKQAAQSVPGTSEVVVADESDSNQSENTQNEEQNSEEKPVKRWGSKDLVIENLKLLNENGQVKTLFKCGERVTIQFNYVRNNIMVENPVIGIGIFRSDGVHCYGTNTFIDRITGIQFGQRGEVKCVIDNLSLLEGHYSLDVALESVDGFPYDYYRNIAEFDVISELRDVGVARLAHHWYVDGKLLK